MSSLRRNPVRKVRGPTVDMSPFIGIIVCVIGVVIFLISGVVAVDGITLEQGPSPESIQRALPLAQRMAASAARTAELSAEIRKAQEAAAQREALEKRMAAAKGEAEKMKNDLHGPEMAERVRLHEKTEQMKAELGRIKEELAKMPIEIEKAKREVTESEGSVTLPKIGKSGEGVTPIWVECHTAGLSIFRVKGGASQKIDVSFDDISGSDEFKQILDEVSNSSKGEGRMVINLLVRTGGIKTYDEVIKPILERDIPFSAIPVARPGKIRFRE